MKSKDESKKTNKKVIHNKDYNKAKILLTNSDFQKTIKKIKENFTYLGCPLPKGGLKSEEEFEVWKDKYFSCRKKKKQFTGFYGIVFYEILVKNNINPNDKFFNDFLRSYTFFNQKEPETIPLKAKVTFNKKTKDYELYIQILPQTTKKDVCNFWNIVKKEKKNIFKEKDLKYKTWEGRNRDLEIYQRYIQLSKLSFEKRKEKFGYGSVGKIILNELSEKFRRLTPEIIRASILKVKTKGNLL